MQILVLNTGSSSVKFSLIEARGERTLLEGQADWAAEPAGAFASGGRAFASGGRAFASGGRAFASGGRLVVRRPGAEPATAPLSAAGHGAAVTQVLAQLTEDERRGVAAVGHRVVHGGAVYTRSVPITPAVKARIAALAELAPLHNPVNLEGIEAAERAWPGVPQVAVFDTAFHATLPEAARTYPVPFAWTRDWQLRRYGFHGLSHAYCAARAAEVLGRGPDGLRLVICHLGNGCSAAAVRDGRSVDTSMGFTPLEGLMMGTRSGSVDPGLLLYVLQEKGLTADDLDRALNREAGLLGVSGVSADLRRVQEAAHGGDARARLALDVYAHRLRQVIGALTATLGGLDALVFTAGVGEHAAEVRAAACRGLACLGLELDPAANAACRPDADVATPASRGRVLVIATREDLTIVRETVRVLREDKSP